MQIKHLTLAAMFAALSAIGGLIKIPLGIGTTALDSAPALIAVAFISPPLAGAAAFIGHIASALYVGFPLGPFHLLIAGEMLLIVYIFARMYQANLGKSKWLFFIVGNGLLSPLPFYFLMSPAFFIGVLPGIFIATVFNAVVAGIVFPALKNLPQLDMRASQ